MIPRLKPYLGKEELIAPFRNIVNSVSQFEIEFAKEFGSKLAISFPYGRSALWAFFKAMGIEGAEIILPAYTCSVVAHAIVLSNNIPRFVDICLDDYNMNLDQVETAITSQTRAIIATHLFGYPLNLDKLEKIVYRAERKFGQKIWIIQDCAHSFGAEFHSKPVTNRPDISLFGLNISKQMTSIFGGMLTTDNEVLFQNIKNWRDANSNKPPRLKTIRRWFYLLSIYPAFFNPFYGFVYFLQYRTPLLNHLTRAYHLDEKIHFPPGFNDFLLPIEARVGLVQLKKYAQNIQHRRETASYFHANLKPHDGWVMPPIVEGATYSHYVIRVPNRNQILQKAAQRGLQLGELIEYSIPESDQYIKFVGSQTFPNSALCSRSTINLPIYAGLSQTDRERIVDIMNSIIM